MKNIEVIGFQNHQKAIKRLIKRTMRQWQLPIKKNPFHFFVRIEKEDTDDRVHCQLVLKSGKTAWTSSSDAKSPAQALIKALNEIKMRRLLPAES